WALSRADIIYIADIYPAREKAADFPGVDGEMVASAVRKAGGRHVEFFTERGLLFSAVRELAVDGNMLLFMGAGDITHLASETAEFCIRQESANPG
ncbi:MAG: UDP-N-acetylmuramate--L-alanine ligase, partial [Chlorobiaceae bacterium]|nr:UDP-N-acetylmuramate--L-alanine ligase [Chlorobiaceae bacterium]